jgi:hypothetical protein
MARMFISPHRPEDWTDHGWKQEIDFQIDPDTLAQTIQDRWPDADIQTYRFPETPVEWKFESQFSGWLLHSLETVSITDGPKESLIEFVLWYRSFVAPSIRLFLQDESSMEFLELTNETTTGALEEFLGY